MGKIFLIRAICVWILSLYRESESHWIFPWCVMCNVCTLFFFLRLLIVWSVLSFFGLHGRYVKSMQIHSIVYYANDCQNAKMMHFIDFLDRNDGVSVYACVRKTIERKIWILITMFNLLQTPQMALHHLKMISERVYLSASVLICFCVCVLSSRKTAFGALWIQAANIEGEDDIHHTECDESN